MTYETLKNVKVDLYTMMSPHSVTYVKLAAAFVFYYDITESGDVGECMYVVVDSEYHHQSC